MRRTKLHPGGIATYLVLLASAVGPARGEDAKAEAPPIAESSGTFESHGKAIAVERFEPSAPGKYPAVVVLHGSGGLGVGGFMFRGLARELAARGYVVVLPHYFDRTGTTIADMPTMYARFREWAETVADANSYALGLESADGERLAIVGFSLGGYLAVSLSTFDPRVDAVVDYFGGLPDELADRAGRLAPTLILHGDADPIVPVSEARELDGRLTSAGVEHELRIFAGAGHGFLGATGREADRLAAEFLDRRLKGAR
jgi:carboxymethylenebutenolidase